MTDTPRHGHDPIVMQRKLPDLTEEYVDSLPWGDLPGGGRVKRFPQRPTSLGEFYWDLQDGKRQLVVMLPSPGNGLLCNWPVTHPNGGGHQWTWDGDEDAPTLHPSLHAAGIWHGWVRAGRLVEA